VQAVLIHGEAISYQVNNSEQILQKITSRTLSDNKHLQTKTKRFVTE